MTSSSSIPTFGLHAGGAEARFLDFCGNAFAMLVQSLTDVGDGKLAGSFLAQDGADLIFQKHQLAADSGFGNIELFRSAMDAARVDDLEKQQQRVQVQLSCHALHSLCLGLQLLRADPFVPIMER